jgi:hypothetical protein
MALRRRDVERLDRAERADPRAGLEAAEIDRRCVLRAKLAMGAVVRDALARHGIDPDTVPRLCVVVDAAAELAAIPDTPELQRADEQRTAASRMAATEPDPCTAWLLDLAARFAGGRRPDFAAASFAQLLAWALAQPEA